MTAKDLPIDIGVATDVGTVRDLNEDSVLVETLAPGPNNPWSLGAVLMVADGLGGHQAGEIASGLAAETVRRIFISNQDVVHDHGDLPQCMARAVRDVNREVHEWTEDGGISRPATTLTLCLIRSSQYDIAHVGDSRAYLIGRGQARQVTHDDSWVAEAVRRGQMSEEEALLSPFRNQITKSVGTQPDVEPTLYAGELDDGDVLLLCSDGLTEYVVPDEIHDHVQNARTMQEACQALAALARERGGHDNISVAAAAVGCRVLTAPTRVVSNGASKKPATWPPAEPVARPRDPNRLLRALTAGFAGLAILVLGVWTGRSIEKRRHPDISSAVFLAPDISTRDPLASSSRPTHGGKKHMGRHGGHKTNTPSSSDGPPTDDQPADEHRQEADNSRDGGKGTSKRHRPGRTKQDGSAPKSLPTTKSLPSGHAANPADSHSDGSSAYPFTAFGAATDSEASQEGTANLFIPLPMPYKNAEPPVISPADGDRTRPNR
jgi:serine/threonine protein phosphatase PrpC